MNRTFKQRLGQLASTIAMTVLLGAAVWAVSPGAVAQSVPLDDHLVATGDAKAGSTYSRVFNEFASRYNGLGANPKVKEQVTTGGIQNKNMLLEQNAVDGAFIQSDFLFVTQNNNPAQVADVKVLVPLFPEEIHVIARADTKKEGGWGVGNIKFGQKNVTFNTLNDLSGRPVGAVGGSVLTAKLIAARSGINFQVSEYKDNASMLADLTGGKIDAVIAVGGAPYGLVLGLSNAFRLLPIDVDAMQAGNKDSLLKIYQPATLSYDNLSQDGVKTLAVQAVWAVHQPTTPQQAAGLLKIRNGFGNVAQQLKGTRGVHAKWRQIIPLDQSKWALLSL